MAKKTKKSRDLNVLASQIVSEATEDESTSKSEDQSEQKNPAAVALGRLGGLKGGPARAKKLTKKQRQEIARQAAKARWSKK